MVTTGTTSTRLPQQRGLLLVLGQLVVDEVWTLATPITDRDTWMPSLSHDVCLGGLAGHALHEHHRRAPHGVKIALAGYAGAHAADLLDTHYPKAATTLTRTGDSIRCVCLQQPDGARLITNIAPADDLQPPDCPASALLDYYAPTALLIDDRVLPPPLRDWISCIARTAHARHIPVIVEANSDKPPLDFAYPVTSGRPDAVPDTATTALIHDGTSSVTVRTPGTTSTWHDLTFPTDEPGVGRGDRFVTAVALHVATGQDLLSATQSVLMGRNARWERQHPPLPVTPPATAPPHPTLTVPAGPPACR